MIDECIHEYIFSGSLPENASTYVKREADEQLYEALQQGKFCYVLNSRQSGKSSLRLRTMSRLSEAGVECASIDLSSINVQGATQENWYADLITILTNSFVLDVNPKDLRIQNEFNSPLMRFTLFLKEHLLAEIEEPVVIFIDEIDSVLSLNFPTDDFFAFIRACHNQRVDNSAYQRLTFCLLGVASPNNLIQDKNRTPFNIGKAISLKGFQLDEAEPLEKGLRGKFNDSQAVMQEILNWTGGQPFLTQKLCQFMVEESEKEKPRTVEQVVFSRIIESWESQDEPEHLKTIRDRILRGGGRMTGKLLAIYEEVLRGGNLSPVQIADTPEQVYLRLSGLVVEQQGNLRVYNRIYESIFNLDWVNRELKNIRPDFYSTAFGAWFKSKCQDSSHLLRGENLSDALTWAEEKSLSNQDYQFITASQKWEFSQAQKRTQRQTVIGGVILAASLVLAATAIVFAGAANQQRMMAVSQRDEANQQKEVSESALKQAQSETKKANWERQTAKKNAVTAQKQAKNAKQQQSIAENNAKAAATKQQAAEAKVKQAEQSLINSQRKLQQTEETASQQIKTAQLKVNQANKQAGEAREGAQKAHFEMKQAQVSLRKAQQARTQALKERKIIQEGSELERLGNIALRQFEYDKTPQVVIAAMEAGNRLKALVKDGRPLEKYPATSPILALNTVLNIPKRKTFRGHESSVYNVAFSSDGKRIITASRDKTAKVWDINGNLLKTLKGHQDWVGYAAFSPDGQRIITSSNDQTSRLWDITGKLLKTFKNHGTTFIPTTFFSPDGKYIANTSADGTAKVWDTNGKLLRTLGRNKKVYYTAFSSDGKQIITLSDDKTAKVWDINGNLLQNLKKHVKKHDRINSLAGVYYTASSPDAKVLAIDINDFFVRIYKGYEGKSYPSVFSPDGKKIFDAPNLLDINGKLLQTLKGHQEHITHAAFSPDSKQIVTASRDKTAKVWGINSNLIQTLEGHHEDVKRVAFSPDGKRIVTVSDDKTAKVWDINNTLLQGVQKFIIPYAAFSPDGKRIVTVSDDKTAKVWDINGNLLQTLKGHKNLVSHIAFSSDGKRIITVSTNDYRKRIAKVWDINGNLLQTLKKRELLSLQTTTNSRVGSPKTRTGREVVRRTIVEGSVIIIPEFPIPTKEHLKTFGKFILIESGSNTEVWDINGNLRQTLKGNSATFSPDGKLIVTTSADKTAKIWDINGNLRQTLKGNSASFSPDGKLFVTASAGKTEVWDINGNLRQTLKGNSATFSPDGKLIVTASADKTVKVWNINGKLLQTLEGHQEGVYWVAFSPDSKRIVTLSHDKTAKVWDTNGKLLQTLKGHHDWVSQVAFSPDSKRILTTSWDKTAKVWDMNGKLLQTLARHDSSVKQATFSPDGQHILTSFGNGAVKVWRVESLDELLKRGCDWLEDYFVTNPEARKRTGCVKR